MFFQSRNSHTGPLFRASKIRKSFEKTALENCIFISKSLERLLPSIFNNWLKFYFESHSHDTRWSNLGYLNIPSYHTQKKLALKPIQDFPPRFGPAIREFADVINGVFI